jgi:hypothetical protein
LRFNILGDVDAHITMYLAPKISDE